MEGHARPLHLVGRGERADPKFLDAQHSIVVRVEAQPGVFLGRHAQHFHGELLKSQQELGFVLEQQVDVRTGKLNDDVRVFEVRVALFALRHFELQLETRVFENGPEKRIDPRSHRAETIFPLRHRLPPPPFLDFAAGG